MQTWTKLRTDTLFYLSRKLNKGLLPPERVSINLTLRCNLTCTMCTTCYDSPELSLREIKDIIDQTAEWGCEVLNPLGGEPFMRADLEQILRYSVQKGFYVSLTTNGTLISPSRAKYLAEIPSDRLHFNFSLDGNQQSNDLIRGQGSFQKTIRGLQNLRDADQEMGNSRRKILSNTILHAQNCDGFLEILQEQANLGFDGVQILNLFRSEDDEVQNSLWFQPEHLPKLQTLSQELIQLKKSGALGRYQIQNSIEELQKIPIYYSEKLEPLEAPCWAGWKELYINADGQAIMCDGSLDFLNGAFGSVRENTLQELWGSPKLVERRKVVKQCKTPCVQTCYLRQSSDSATKIAVEAFKLSVKELDGKSRSRFQSWQRIPDSKIRFELSDVSHSDWEGEQTPHLRWKELTRNVSEIPQVGNWTQMRDQQELDFSRGFMGFEFLRKWVKDLEHARLQFETLSLSWRGEPLLHPEIEPILEFCAQQIEKGTFKRLEIESSGVFLTDQTAKFAQRELPQTWILDLDRGDGAGVAILSQNLGIQTQLILKHSLCPTSPLSFYETTKSRYPSFPVWLGSQPPRQGNWLWFSRQEQNNFFLDQQTDQKLSSLAQKIGAKVESKSTGKCLAPRRSMLISWDGKATLCPRDSQLQNTVGDANHQSLGAIWESLASTRAEAEARGTPNRPFCQDCGWFFGVNAV